MTIFSEELEQRLKSLEIEQEQQSRVVNDLGEMNEIIRNIEAALAKIDNYRVKQNEDSFERDELAETRRMERELERMQKQELGRPGKGIAPKRSSKQSISPEQPQKTALKPSTNPTTPSYVICLTLNPKSPQEWSGKGWRGAGKGLRYTNLEQAKQTFQKLKKQWPSYPLKIFKR
jgi:uncharacterized coiled-coil protein SlyX